MVDNALEWVIGVGNIDQVVDRIASLRTPHPTRYQQGECWGRFMTVTAANSHYSAQQFLADRQYDYASALNDWARLGYLQFVLPPPLPAAAEEPKKKKPNEEDKDGKDKKGPSSRQVLGLSEVIANHEAQDHDGRPIEPLDGMDEGDEIVRRQSLNEDGAEVLDRRDVAGDLLLPDEDEPFLTEDNGPTHERTGRRGFIINPDSASTIPGMPDPTRFDIERLIEGKYTPLSHPLKDSMDFDDHRKVGLLPKWRNEEYAKITRELK